MINLRKINGIAITLLLLSLISCGKGCGSDEDSAHFLDLMPASTEMVLGVNIDNMMQNSLGQVFQKEAPESWKKWASNFSYLSASFEMDELSQKPEPTLLIFRIKDSPENVLKNTEAFAKAIGEDFNTQEEKYENITIYIEESKSSIKEPAAFAFIGKNLLLADKNKIKKAIDTLHKKSPPASQNKKLDTAFRKIDTKKVVWFLGLVSEENIEKLKTTAQNPMFDVPDLKALNLELDYPKDLTLSLGMWTKGSNEAQELTKKLNAALELFGTQAKSEFPKYQKTIDSIKINPQEDWVSLSVSFDEALLGDAKTGLKEMIQSFSKELKSELNTQPSDG